MMKSTVKVLYALIVFAMLLSACSPAVATQSAGEAKSSKTRNENPSASSDQVNQLAGDDNAFAFDLYGVLKGQDGNLFYSPYSISLALAMTYAGAAGNTADQMRQTLHFNLSDDVLHAAFNALSLDLQKAAEVSGEGQTPFELNIANSIWGQKDFAFQEAFLDLLAENYGAGMRLTDFAADPEAARQMINQWVSDQTKERIKDLIPQGSIDAATRMVLANAIYFKAAWLRQFDEAATQTAPFYLLDGTTIDAQMMNQQENFGYFLGNGFKAIDLPYADGRMSMTVILPDDGQFAGVESQLSADFFNQITSGLQYSEVKLSMPKFTYESSFTLNDALAALGMTDAFDPNAADFSGMDGARDLYIGSVLHKAFVAVDETGTEAAAATAVIMELAMAPAPEEPLSFTMDHPFIYVIRDNATGSILFVGRVLEPKAE